MNMFVFPLLVWIHEEDFLESKTEERLFKVMGREVLCITVNLAI